MTGPPLTLAFLAYHWGDGYLLSWVRGRWVALRRDARYYLVADSLEGLQTLIIADHRANRVSRRYDPPDAGDYLESPATLFTSRVDEGIPDDDAGVDANTLITVRELRRAFPLWTIIYCTRTQTWTGRTRKATISHSSAVSLCIALTLIERRGRQLAGEPRAGHRIPTGYRSSWRVR